MEAQKGVGLDGSIAILKINPSEISVRDSLDPEVTSNVDVGRASKRFRCGYFDTVNATSITGNVTVPQASSTVLGGIKVGSNLTMNASTGVLSADAQQYNLPIATTSTLGGVKQGNNISIDTDGTISGNEAYTLPTASDAIKGGVRIGSRLTMIGDVLSADSQTYTLPTASGATLGGVKIGSRLTMTGDILSADAQTYTLPNDITVDNVDAVSSTLNVGGKTGTTTVNVGTNGTTETINVGTGSGVKTITLGSGTDDTTTINGNLNVTGTTTTINVDNVTVKDKLVTLNKGGVTASGGSSGIEVEENSSITAWIKTNAARDKWLCKAPTGAEFELGAASSGSVLLNPTGNQTISTFDLNVPSLTTDAINSTTVLNLMNNNAAGGTLNLWSTATANQINIGTSGSGQCPQNSIINIGRSANTIGYPKTINIGSINHNDTINLKDKTLASTIYPTASNVGLIKALPGTGGVTTATGSASTTGGTLVQVDSAGTAYVPTAGLVGQDPVAVSYTSSGSWTVPAGVTRIKIEAVAGGGSGASGTADGRGGGGGGAGQYVNAIIAVTPGQSITFVIGSGGAAVSQTNNTTPVAGNNGTATTISATNASISLQPGGGGRLITQGANYAAAGGDGGTGTSVSGSNIIYYAFINGGGGGAAAASSASADSTGGIGGASFFGGGTGGRAQTNTYGGGGAYGGGGGGGCSGGSSQTSSIAGSPGIAFITYLQPSGIPATYTVSAPLSLSGSNLSIPQASSSTNGFLSATDYGQMVQRVFTWNGSGANAGVYYNVGTLSSYGIYLISAHANEAAQDKAGWSTLAYVTYLPASANCKNFTSGANFILDVTTSGVVRLQQVAGGGTTALVTVYKMY